MLLLVDSAKRGRQLPCRLPGSALNLADLIGDSLDKDADNFRFLFPTEVDALLTLDKLLILLTAKSPLPPADDAGMVVILPPSPFRCSIVFFVFELGDHSSESFFGLPGFLGVLMPACCGTRFGSLVIHSSNSLHVSAMFCLAERAAERGVRILEASFLGEAEVIFLRCRLSRSSSSNTRKDFAGF